MPPLDEAMAKSRLFYARFMDDWVILVPTRWKLRRIVARKGVFLVLGKLVLPVPQEIRMNPQVSGSLGRFLIVGVRSGFAGLLGRRRPHDTVYVANDRRCVSL